MSHRDVDAVLGTRLGLLRLCCTRYPYTCSRENDRVLIHLNSYESVQVANCVITKLFRELQETFCALTYHLCLSLRCSWLEV